MLTQEPTPEMIQTWKHIFETHRAGIRPNRKTGAQVDAYFRSNYDYIEIERPSFADTITANILENMYYAAKCPGGKRPVIRTYNTGEVLVGIDLVSGYFQVECEKSEKAVPIYDDLFVYRGLDEIDLTNFFLVAEYVRLTGGRCTEKKRMMRDKSRKREYFDRCIQYHSQQSEKLVIEINSYEEQTDQRVLDRKNALLQKRVNILVAKYSKGDALSELKEEFEKLVDCFMECWNFDEHWYHLFHGNCDSWYIDDLRFASLAFLLNVDAQIKNKIRDRLQESFYYDCLIDSILSNTENLPDKEALTYPEIVMKLVCAAEQRSYEPLKEYLQVWYHDFKYDPWYHGFGIFDYWGKWSFVAAAVVKRFGLDDELLKDDPFYPYDLAHFTG